MPPVVFPFMPDGGAGMVERYGYRTDIIGKETEQRIKLRQLPTGGMEFTANLIGRERLLAQRLLERHQADEWAVPLWQYATKLAEDLPGTGEFDIYCDPDPDAHGYGFSWLPFADAAGAGQPVLLWRSPDYYLLVDTYFQEITPGPVAHIASVDAITKAFSAGDLVIPARRGRLPQLFSNSRASIDTGSQPLSFRFGNIDPLGFYNFEPGASISSPETHDGFDVLEVRVGVPSRSEPLDDQLSREFSLLDGQLGKLDTFDRVVAPSRLLDWHWVCTDRYEAALLREFVDMRRGRAVPVWVSSLSSDLELAAAVSMGSTTFAIVDGADYANNLWPSTGARRHLEFRLADGTVRRRKVTEVNAGDGTITLDEAIDIDLPADALISFLRLCRLEDDEIEIQWYGPAAAESRFKLRELPAEAPL